jgi:hypothetical protein
MSSGANVSSIEAVERLKAALCLFVDAARDSLAAVDQESRRTIDFLTHEQLGYWQEQVKRAHEAIASARSELARRRLRSTPDNPVDDEEQKQELRRANARLAYAEDRVDVVKKWRSLLARAFDEYISIADKLADLVDGNPPRCVAAIDGILAALDAYLSASPPETSLPSLPGETS